jgi:hypothetical protein
MPVHQDVQTTTSGHGAATNGSLWPVTEIPEKADSMREGEAVLAASRTFCDGPQRALGDT